MSILIFKEKIMIRLLTLLCLFIKVGFLYPASGSHQEKEIFDNLEMKKYNILSTNKSPDIFSGSIKYKFKTNPEKKVIRGGQILLVNKENCNDSPSSSSSVNEETSDLTSETDLIKPETTLIIPTPNKKEKFAPEVELEVHLKNYSGHRIVKNEKINQMDFTLEIDIKSSLIEKESLALKKEREKYEKTIIPEDSELIILKRRLQNAETLTDLKVLKNKKQWLNLVSYLRNSHRIRKEANIPFKNKKITICKEEDIYKYAKFSINLNPEQEKKLCLSYLYNINKKIKYFFCNYNYPWHKTPKQNNRLRKTFQVMLETAKKNCSGKEVPLIKIDDFLKKKLTYKEIKEFYNEIGKLYLWPKKFTQKLYRATIEAIKEQKHNKNGTTKKKITKSLKRKRKTLSKKPVNKKKLKIVPITKKSNNTKTMK